MSRRWYPKSVRWTPETLASRSGGRLIQPSERSIAGAFIDSREPLAGGVFVPIVAVRDGHDFIQDAVDAGAAAVLQQVGRPLPKGDVTVVEVPDTLEALTSLARDARRAVRGPVVAITGSNGKTTTRSMIGAALATGFARVLSTRGNLNNHLGVPLTLLGEPHEPDAMVVELGMNAPGEVDHLASIVTPTVGVITGVALEHVEFLGSLEAIARAEAEVVGHVQSDGALVIPGDEPLLRGQIPSGYLPTVLEFGPEARSFVQIESVEVGERTVARLRPRGEPALEVSLRLFGAHNARNAAAALAVGMHLGLSSSAMTRALEGVDPVGDRGRVIRRGQHLLLADCYNANPGSMEGALRSLAALRPRRGGRLVAVLGDMLELGPEERQHHEQLGVLAAELGLDLLVTLGALSEHTATAAREHGVHAEHFEDDVEGAVARVAACLREGRTTVLVKGSRGMRLERVVDALMQDHDRG
jgi:UDP-N-acetylmuramoyl-tripeptide--D-alanyl-D-alanine ligase